MILIIDTTQGTKAAFYQDGRKLASVRSVSARAQAEKLLVLVERLLQKLNKKLADIEEIEVVNKGGTFTSLRIGVMTANALGYALKIPVRAVGQKAVRRQGFYIVEPEYGREPNITMKKK